MRMTGVEGNSCGADYHLRYQIEGTGYHLDHYLDSLEYLLDTNWDTNSSFIWKVIRRFGVRKD